MQARFASAATMNPFGVSPLALFDWPQPNLAAVQEETPPPLQPPDWRIPELVRSSYI